MKQSLLILAVLLAAACPLVADVFVLKDGTELEGTIVREDEKSYTIEIQVTRSIKDERIVPKDQVAKIRKPQPDLVAFEAIKDLAPAPDLLDAGEYTRRIASLEKFISEHRDSDKVADVNKMLAELKKEANEILAGGIKLGGVTITSEDYATNRMEIDARIQNARIRKLIDQGELGAALRQFSAFDKDFAGTPPHTELLPLIQRAIQSYKAQAEQLLATYGTRLAQRKAGVQRLPVDERRITEAAIAEENRAMEARFRAEKAGGIGWVTMDPYFKPAIDDTIAFADRELVRLKAAPATAIKDRGKLFRETLGKIRGGSDAAGITNALNEARSARMPVRYINILESAAKTSGGNP